MLPLAPLLPAEVNTRQTVFKMGFDLNVALADIQELLAMKDRVAVPTVCVRLEHVHERRLDLLLVGPLEAVAA
jgi:hypothetical protein